MNKPDEYYLNFIRNTKFLKSETKTTYLKKIEIIQKDIYKVKISTILKNPERFHEKVTKYCANTKGRLNDSLSNHSVDMFFAVILALFNYNQELKEDQFDLYNKWKKVNEKQRKTIDEKYKSNKPTERQAKAYVSYNDIVRIADGMKEGSQERLLLRIYTEIPPTRSDHYKTKIYSSDPNNETENYIVLGTTNIVVLNDYKTAKRYGRIDIDIPKKLVNEITKSLKKQPREYLFTSGRTNEPYDKKNSFNKWANRVLKKHFNDGFSLTMLRHIYISRTDLGLLSKSELEQEKISSKMCHSSVQLRRYLWNLSELESNIHEK